VKTGGYEIKYEEDPRARQMFEGELATPGARG